MNARSWSRSRRLFAAVSVVALVVGACIGPGGASGRQVTIQTVSAINKGQKVTATGTLQPATQIPVPAQLAGQVESVDVQDGQTVTTGQRLFKVDDTTQQQQVDALEASGNAANAAKTTTPKASAPKQQPIDFGKLFAPFNQVTAQRQQVLQQQIASFGPVTVQSCLNPPPPQPPPDTDDCRRILALQDQILAVQQQNAQFQFDEQQKIQSSSASSAGSAAALSGAGTSSTSSSSVNPNQSQIDQLQAQVDNAVVNAPIGGQVAFTNLAGGAAAAAAASSANNTSLPTTIRTGTLVTQGQTVMTVYDTAGVQVVAQVDQSDVPQVRVNQPATMTIDAYPGETIDGQVTTIGVSPNTSSSGAVTFSVGITIPAARVPNWRPGLSASVTIQTLPAPKGLQVQNTALLHEGGSTYVFKVVNGKAVKTAITTGPSQSGFTTVDSGLAPGDKVVTSDVQALKDGESVSASGGSP